MTTNRDFDRIARAWLDLMPDEAPDRTVAAVLQAAEAAPQMRRPLRRLPWRFIPMYRIPIAIGAAAIVVAAGVLFFARSGSGPNVASSPPPSPTISPAPRRPDLRRVSAIRSRPGSGLSGWAITATSSRLTPYDDHPR